MKIDSKILSRIPEYLIEEKDFSELEKEIEIRNKVTGGSDDIDDLEVLERLEPTTFDIEAALIDKIAGDLKPYNTWTNFEDYSKEFRLDELFGDLSSKFAINQVELLKGFFNFKGTDTDIRYVLKMSGYDVVIHDSNYFLDNYPSEIMTQPHFGTSMLRFLSEYDDSILSPAFEELFEENQNFTNQDLVEYIDCTDYTEIEYNNLITAINEWVYNKLHWDENYTCFISMTTTVDFDKNDLHNFRPLKQLIELLKSIAYSRLSICVLIRSFVLALIMHDKYEIVKRIKDIFDYDASFIFKDPLHWRWRKIKNVKSDYIQNIDPWDIPGLLYWYDDRFDREVIKYNLDYIHPEYGDSEDDSGDDSSDSYDSYDSYEKPKKKKWYKDIFGFCLEIEFEDYVFTVENSDIYEWIYTILVDSLGDGNYSKELEVELSDTADDIYHLELLYTVNVSNAIGEKFIIDDSEDFGEEELDRTSDYFHSDMLFGDSFDDIEKLHPNRVMISNAYPISIDSSEYIPGERQYYNDQFELSSLITDSFDIEDQMSYVNAMTKMLYVRLSNEIEAPELTDSYDLDGVMSYNAMLDQMVYSHFRTDDSYEDTLFVFGQSGFDQGTFAPEDDE